MLASASRLGSVLLAVSLAGPLAAQDWPHWRGPTFDGAAQVEGLPATFGPDQNVRWTADLPGPSACTPIVVGDRIFLSSVDTARERLVALCLNAEDGSVVWQRDAGSGYQPGELGSRVAGGRRSNYASPSPTTDGERVVFFFGNGDLVAYDYAGQELWRHNVQKKYGDFAFQWTFSATPTLWDGVLVLPVLQRDVEVARSRRRGRPAEASAPREGIESFLLGLDPATGEERYRHVRPCEARVESRESYGTPIPFVGEDGRKELLIVGGDVITGHDPQTGAELWRWGTWNPGHREQWWRVVPSPVVGGGVVLACAPKRAPVFAVELGGEGTLSDDALRWKSDGRPNPVSSDVPTPAFDGSHFYVLSDVRGALSKVDPNDGKVLWSIAMPGEHLWRASPTVTDGKVYCLNHGGLVVVLDAASGEVVHQVAMAGEDADQIRASVVAARGSLFVRTDNALYCIGQ